MFVSSVCIAALVLGNEAGSVVCYVPLHVPTQQHYLSAQLLICVVFYSFSHLHSPLLKTWSASPRTISSSIVFVYSYCHTQPLSQIPMPDHVGTFEPRLQPLMVSSQSWWSYGKIGDCEQSIILIKPYGFGVMVARVVGGCGTHGLIAARDPFKNVGWYVTSGMCLFTFFYLCYTQTTPM